VDRHSGRTRTNPAVVFVAVVLGVLLAFALVAVAWRIAAQAGMTGDIHVVPRLGQYAGPAR
jgi:hypothetical protein